MAEEAMPAAQTFVDTEPGAATQAPDDTAGADATRRRRRRGGRGRGRDEGSGDAVNAASEETQDETSALDSAPIAAESVLSEAPPAAAVKVAEAPAAENAVPSARAPVSAPAMAAPVMAALATATPAAALEEAPPMAAPSRPAPPVAVSAPAAAPAPAPAPYRLPTDSLAAIASGAGMEWVNSDSAKIRAVQDAMANEPKPIQVARQPKPRVAIDDGPLMLVETRKDLSQVKLPFDTPPAP